MTTQQTPKDTTVDQQTTRHKPTHPPPSLPTSASHGKLLREREWPTEGTLQLQDGVDIACQYCTFDWRKEFAFAHTDHADRKFDNISALHGHVRTWHIERHDGNRRGVKLAPSILTRDGKGSFLPEKDCGPLVNSTQLRAAERSGWTPSWPENLPPAGYRRRRAADDPRALWESEADRDVYVDRGNPYLK
jgi:hypothetical protein